MVNTWALFKDFASALSKVKYVAVTWLLSAIKFRVKRYPQKIETIFTENGKSRTRLQNGLPASNIWSLAFVKTKFKLLAKLLN